MTADAPPPVVPPPAGGKAPGSDAPQKPPGGDGAGAPSLTPEAAGVGCSPANNGIHANVERENAQRLAPLLPNCSIGPETSPPGTQPKPGDPAVKPGDPAVKPGDPAVKPGDPAVKPGDPAVKPGDPAVKPGDPAAKPGDPTQPSLSPPGEGPSKDGPQPTKTKIESGAGGTERKTEEFPGGWTRVTDYDAYGNPTRQEVSRPDPNVPGQVESHSWKKDPVTNNTIQRDDVNGQTREEERARQTEKDKPPQLVRTKVSDDHTGESRETKKDSYGGITITEQGPNIGSNPNPSKRITDLPPGANSIRHEHSGQDAGKYEQTTQWTNPDGSTTKLKVTGDKEQETGTVSQSGPGHEDVRVTRDKKTGQIQKTMGGRSVDAGNSTPENPEGRLDGQHKQPQLKPDSWAQPPQQSAPQDRRAELDRKHKQADAAHAKVMAMLAKRPGVA